MDIKLPRIGRFSFVYLVLFCCLAFCVLTSNKGRVQQVPNLLIDLLGGIPDPNNAADRPCDLALNVNKRAVCVDLNDLLAERGSTLIAHMTRHLSSFENLAGMLAHTDRPGRSVSPTHTVGSVLH